MKGVARIFFDGGGLIVPAKTPYERELLLQHVEAYTKRHGRVGVELNRRDWIVSVDSAEQTPCATCLGQVEGLSYSSAGRTVCGHCVRHELR